MTESDMINISPHLRTLSVLGDIEFPPWQCLAELIDNAFDDFLAAGAIDTGVRPTVTITLPTAAANLRNAEVRVTDNGRGMDLQTLSMAIRAGWTGNDRHGALGLFGMGFNIATARLGRKTRIMTTQAGDPDWIVVDLDLPALARVGQHMVPARREPKADIAEHGTTVLISDLKREHFDAIARPASQNKIREKLGDVYSYLLLERDFLITVNGRKVQPRRHCVWDEKRFVTRNGVEISAIQKINHPLPSKAACLECGHWNDPDAKVCEDCESTRLEPRERRIHGWLGIQRYAHISDYGIDFLRNGRKILQKDKRIFLWDDPDGIAEPAPEYPIDTKNPEGRIVGEIHCDHVAPNYQKNAFEYDSHDWRTVIRTIRGDGPLRPKIGKALGYPDNNSKLALLYAGFRRNDPGLNYLIPGDGRTALRTHPLEWAKRFHSGDAEYQSDEIWYQAAWQHDNPVQPEPDEAADDEILPGMGIDDDTDDSQTPGTGSTPSSGATPQPETLDQRLQRYRDHAEVVRDLTGRYEAPDLGHLELTAWAVRGQELLDRHDQPTPLFVQMSRAPRAEAFIDANHKLFSEFGVDMRDQVLVEVAEFLRVRKGTVNLPLSGVLSDLKARSNSTRVTPAGIADEAEALLARVREGMAAAVAASPSDYWKLLTDGERAAAERTFAAESGAASWDEAKNNGDFLLFTPANTLIRMIENSPSAFLDGNVFDRRYATLTDEGARTLVVSRLVGLIGDLALLEEHRPKTLDLDELNRARISCRLLGRELISVE
ncbi:ATP-binding protein [Actinospica durhamensis]|uniref:ATP-binding protein n=1 Tax=Actinospica durhamensis TaxID=1508375 RepID=A0A941EKV7_9ACTN|nr:ATP-binding protein [Actinospica durhamensis]MBR7833477.1 ATP-binding protein [Actinospica durhamensis]